MKKIKKYGLNNNTGDVILKDRLNDLTPYDLSIGCVTDIENPILRKRYNLDYNEFIDRLYSYRPAPKLIQLGGIGSVKEITEILLPFKDSVEGLAIFKCPDLDDLSFVEDLPALKTLEIYWNRKATKLFDASRMPALKKLAVTDCNKLVDFSGLKNSNLEYLSLYGCNYLSSFTSKLDVGDLGFLEFLPKLEHLGLDFKRTCEESVYLKAIAQVKSLKSVNLRESFFTFEQFAWLSAQLPDLEKGLEPCVYYNSQWHRFVGIADGVDDYYIIGKHKTRVKREKALKYIAAYNDLRRQFADTPEPPPATFTVKI